MSDLTPNGTLQCSNGMALQLCVLHELNENAPSVQASAVLAGRLDEGPCWCPECIDGEADDT